MTNRKTLSSVLKEAALNKFFKHGTSYYKIVDFGMGKTGHIEVDAMLYSGTGKYKGLVALMPLIDSFTFIEEKDLPFKI